MPSNHKFDNVLRQLDESLPHFSDGRINYASSDKAVVVTCFVKYNGRFLLLKRSFKVRVYKQKWHTVAGYLDELKSPFEKVLEELREEIGVHKEEIIKVVEGEPFKFVDKYLNKTWYVYPFLVELKKEPVVSLDSEHEEFRWIEITELDKFDTVPSFAEGLRRVLG